MLPHQRLPSPLSPLPSSLRRILLPLHLCSARRWDSNAESFRTRNFGFENDGDEDDDGAGEELDGWEALEEFVDSIWILNVFKSYGWALPPIIISVLLATGPKAFLLALVLPIGQSTFSFALQKMWSESGNKRKRKAKSKKRRRGSSSWNAGAGPVKEKQGGPNSKKGRRGYKSWVPENDMSTDKNTQDESKYGGWDDLVNENREFTIGSVGRSARTAERSQTTQMEKGKFSRREGKSGTPLLLRLLIAVFPFLGSWTKML